MKNLLLGAISINYSLEDILPWAITSKFDDVDRVLLLYNAYHDQSKAAHLADELSKLGVITIEIGYVDGYGRNIPSFETNTAYSNTNNSTRLVHNVRFYHFYTYLSRYQHRYGNVIVTDVKDVVFLSNPFIDTPYEFKLDNQIVAISEGIRYKDHEWNKRHIFDFAGNVAYDMLEQEVVCVGIIGGNARIMRDICRDIYLLTVGKNLVADQSAFNYLLRLSDYTNSSRSWILNAKEQLLGIHLHVISEGRVEFDMNTVWEYAILHQYDRLPALSREIANFVENRKNEIQYTDSVSQ